MASEKLRKDDQATSEVDYPQFEKKSGKGKQRGEKKGKGGGGGGGGDQKDEQLSLDEISNLRQNAQQKSIDAVKGLEDRYQKAKEKMGSDKTQQATKEMKGATAVEKLGGYVGEKTDTAVGVAADVKDRAVVAGLGAAQFTTEKTVAATKATADLVGGMSGYVGEKAAVAKDSVLDYVGEKVVQAKDAVVSVEESAAAYTARKKAEAERNMEANRRGGGGGDEVEEEESQGGGGGWVAEEMNEGGKRGGGGGGGGMLQAIGETLVEIAQTAKNMVIGESGEGKDNSYEFK
ncbi:seed biotin-containing protein SBP65-like [Impatiens glandulifera]|uniref:seed biotin-containing protein SBP65-like n=1 Tax=Impatiens glandulifera TaxID=253017 RepID=UPI001FB0CA71|nr:seed biotin-containing protein SBP65-like [Impatiens glandulifera]